MSFIVFQRRIRLAAYVTRLEQPQWNGMVRNRMEWKEMEWKEMEWNGMEWNGMEWNGMSGSVHKKEI